MELWIRSQDRKTLTKVKEVYLDYNDTTQILCNQYMFGEQYEEYTKLGEYKTEERALEILDEIQERLKDKYIISIKTPLKPKDSEKWVKYYTEKYKKEFIAETPFEEIKPINSSIYVYEMPKE